MKSIVLYCTEGGSNKEYHVEIASKDGAFVVNTRHGPRGNPRSSGTLTDSPVPLAQAEKLYAARVKRQLAKGYTPDTSGVAFTDTPDAGRVSGWRAPLLAPIDEEQLSDIIASPAWALSEKHFGERRAVEVTADGLRGMNRRGLFVGVPAAWSDVLMQLPVGTLVDGEHVGDNLHIFDCAQIGGVCLRRLGYEERVRRISIAMLGVVTRPQDQLPETSGAGRGFVSLVYVTSDPRGKREMLNRVRGAHGEGVVGRLCSGPYEAGLTPGSVKFKFLESSTCIVLQKNPGKRSVALGMLAADGSMVEVGSVTIPANFDVPADGSLVEIRYLHMNEGGSLYGPPEYLGLRHDMERADCLLSQVKRVRRKGDSPKDEGEGDEGEGVVSGVGEASGDGDQAAARERQRG